MDPSVTLADQLGDEGGPVVLINTFIVPSTDTDRFLAAWSADSAITKRQPGFISAQLHRGIAGSGAFLNHAVWESVSHFRAAFANPEFRARLNDFAESATASPHLFRPVAVPGICVA